MAGTKAGGKKAAATNKKRWGKDWYAQIGAKGGKNGHTGGFASEVVGKDGLTGAERAKKWGTIGGMLSKRGPALHKTTKIYVQHKKGKQQEIEVKRSV